MGEAGFVRSEFSMPSDQVGNLATLRGGRRPGLAGQRRLQRVKVRCEGRQGDAA